ncbi:hypothetical protein LQ384_05390 [Rhodococcus rhodochrous]|uniref:DUF4232 domain-containing protein n=1 Tax=Rhodococcus rhodochrous TaxID=1829 RepID=A0AAW4XC59_RHORH|nr:hypothetical protein [Rhodococcus rhodochrous]MCD2110523.1 hypothetical protein [Rhodococcus rhodochrous]
MLEPTGPLPPEIYWRRRILAIGVSVVVLVLVIWLVVALTGGEDPDQNPEPAAAEVTTSATTTAADASADAASASTTRSGGSSGSSGSGGAEGSASDDADEDDTSTSATTSAAPVPPGQCSDQSLAVRVTADEPNYRVGSEPDFTIVITNIGTSQCERDLGAGLQQVLVYSLDGNERLWANTDCFPESTADIRSLAPGDQAAYSVKWSATTSEPGCQAPREPVGPGAYTVVGQLGGLRSVPEPFNITP